MTTTTRRHFLQSAALSGAAGIFGVPWHAAAQAARGGVLVVGTTQRPRHLNSAVQSGVATMFPAAQIFASPLRMSADYKPMPYLAERWELSPDNRSVKLQLRKDAVFHDGRPVTAEDLKFSLEAIRDNHPFRSMYEPLNAVTIEDVYEPFLIQQGLLMRTPRGRVATPAAWRHLGLAPPPSASATAADPSLFD